VEQPSPAKPVAPHNKLPYERPVLVTHGDLQHITQTVDVRGHLDGGTDPDHNRTS